MKRIYSLYEVADDIPKILAKISPVFSQEFNLGKFLSKLARFSTTIDLMYGYEFPMIFGEFEIGLLTNIFPINATLTQIDKEQKPFHDLGFVFSPYSRLKVRNLLADNPKVNLPSGLKNKNIMIADPSSQATDAKKYAKRCEAYMLKDMHPETLSSELMMLDVWAHECIVTALRSGNRDELFRIALNLSMIQSVPREYLAILYYEGQIAVVGIVSEDPNHIGIGNDVPQLSLSHVVAHRRSGLFTFFHADLRRHFLFEICRKMKSQIHANYHDFKK